MAIRVGASRGAVLDYIANKYHGVFDIRSAEVTLPQNAITEVCQYNPERVFLAIINTGANAAALRPYVSPLPTAGVRLTANGGALILSLETDFVLSAMRWEAIATLGPSSVSIIEVVRELSVEEVSVQQ